MWSALVMHCTTDNLQCSHVCGLQAFTLSDPVWLRPQLLLDEGRKSFVKAAAGGLCTVDASPAHPLERLEESNGVQGIQVNQKVP